MADTENWWQSAPLASGAPAPAPAENGDWWQSAPVVDGDVSEASAQSARLAELSRLTQSSAGGENQDDLVRANMDASRVERATGNSPAQDAVIDPLFGWSDEAYSATVGAPVRMIKDGVGYGEAYKRESLMQNELEDRRRERSPIASTAGDLAGAIVTGGAIAKGGGSLAARAANSGLMTRAAAGAAEGAAYGGVTGAGTADYGEKGEGAGYGAAVGGVAGGAIPVIGAGVRKGWDTASNAARSVFSPKTDAERRVAAAIAADKGREAVSAADDAIARVNGQDVRLVDRGGETTRALARASSNVSPETRARFTDLAEDRFNTQSERAKAVIGRIVGGNVDDLALRESVKEGARASNSMKYTQAYNQNFGGTHPIELDALQQRVPASAVRNAMKVAKSEGREFGEQLIANIDETADTVTFRRAPSLREWDYIQRGLRTSADQNYRSGAGEVGNAYKNLRREIINVLDEANPTYKEARAGAAAAFGAEDAIDAGQKYAKASRNTPEMAKALEKLNPAEKKAFQVGYASELIDKINSTRDRVNVVKSVFGSPEAREKMTLAFGAQKAKEIEAFVRIETGMDSLRGALGGTTTTRQLVELGLVSGTGYGAVTGDWQNASLVGIGAAAAGGVGKYAGRKIDERMLRNIADLLLSDDPAKIASVASRAAKNSKYMDAVRDLTTRFMQLQGTQTGPAGAQ